MRNDLTRIRGLATDIVLMADNFETDFSIKQVSEMAEEIAETAGKLLKLTDLSCHTCESRHP